VWAQATGLGGAELLGSKRRPWHTCPHARMRARTHTHTPHSSEQENTHTHTHTRTRTHSPHTSEQANTHTHMHIRKRTCHHGRSPSVHLERAHRGDQHCAVGLQPRGPALYVHELLQPDVRPKAGLCIRAWLWTVCMCVVMCVCYVCVCAHFVYMRVYASFP